MITHYSKEWLVSSIENGTLFKYLYFWGHTSRAGETVGSFCFSQWFESPFSINGYSYKTSEHWMMAQKAHLFDNHEIAERIIASKKPAEAKDLGRQVLNFDQDIWLQKRFEIVRLGNIHKFNQNPDLMDFLLNTHNRVLVEASPVDSIWGIGMAKDHPDIQNVKAWPGLNLLGFALMEARDFLAEFGHFTALEKDLVAAWDRSANEKEQKDFATEYKALSEREQQVYKLYNPEPMGWEGFYQKL